MDTTIRRAVLRTLATGAFLVAVVPPAAIVASRPPAASSIVLKVSLQPVDDNPMMNEARSAPR